jgi:nucleoside 2-deoxyribosyltransferase/diadenosine tetraphosphate (Ap4A) HIT family hydrolase
MLMNEPILNDITWNNIYHNFNSCRLCWSLSKLGKCYPENTVLHSSANFVTIPALGSLIPGYLLMVSRKHIRSIATLSNDELDNLEQELSELLDYLQPISTRWVIFEHGSSRSYTQSNSCCIDHFHLHLLPLEEGKSHLLMEYISKDLSSKAVVNSFKDLPNYLRVNTDSYILIKSTAGFINVFSGSNLPSQYIRRLIANIYGLGDTWNWRTETHSNNIKTTLELFKFANLMPKWAYFAHAIEDINKEEVDLKIQKFRVPFTLKCPHVQLLSMFEIIDKKVLSLIELHQDSDELLVNIELNFLQYSDILIADLSRIEWQYVGCLMEIVYAHKLGIPVIAIVGDSSIQNRRWLKKHVSHFAPSVESATNYINQNIAS